MPCYLVNVKSESLPPFAENLALKDSYRSEWKRFQVLADMFWARWRSKFLSSLQKRCKWQSPQHNLREDVVLMKDNAVNSNMWPLAIVSQVFPSSDEKVRSVKVKVIREGKPVFLTRPLSELVLLLSE